ncbi:hypothetical protein EDD16DRAFT_1518316 [Pisolithus croceorrhizus]|nr:hypothetical protein EV401DRAFT_1890475 [Pisolithus croceorrhizus]KAI6122697.1 hypothetical protein EDD16DRAFT_1518316 [Pisolithus croceorrhizus]
MFRLQSRSRTPALPGPLLAMQCFKARTTTGVKIPTTLTEMISDKRGNDIEASNASLKAGTSKKFPCQDGLVAEVLIPARDEDMGRNVPDMTETDLTVPLMFKRILDRKLLGVSNDSDLAPIDDDPTGTKCTSTVLLVALDPLEGPQGQLNIRTNATQSLLSATGPDLNHPPLSQ